MSDFANIMCGVPQGSVLGPLKLCLYLLSLSVILNYHKISYHVFVGDTQLYISFKWITQYLRVRDLCEYSLGN